MPAMSFTVEDAEHVVYPHGTVVDGGSSANILYLSTFGKLMIGWEH